MLALTLQESVLDRGALSRETSRDPGTLRRRVLPYRSTLRESVLDRGTPSDVVARVIHEVASYPSTA